MNRSSWVRRGLLAALLAIPLACSNNPFNPRSTVVVTKVLSPTDLTNVAFMGQIGIALDKSVNPPVYVYADPQITIQNGPKEPEAYLNEAIISVTLGGTTVLPTKRFPVVIVVPKGGEYTGILPFLRSDPDVRNAVFPNNTPTRGTQGIAKITLLGKDRNGNEISAAFSTPLTFATIAAPMVSPAPGAVPSTAPTGTPATPVPAGP
ncbi:MAG: hypothetical protein H7338_05445 [Candidatus Sericytochromatia bacterium]|nr:hypothetical protein [Candidatus Sericytochromatia bacterium]